MQYKGSDNVPISDKEFYEVKADVQLHGKSLLDLSSRMGNIERKQEALCEISKSLSLMAQSLKHVESDVTEVKEDQKTLANKVFELENAPAQETLANLKKIKIAAITAVTTMVATGIAGAAIVILAK
jgi:septation ring formation regulator EzrA